MKILAFADLHLGAGTSLGREPGDRLHDQDAVLKRILARAVEHDAEAILVAGDIFEGPTVTPEQMDVFADFVDGCYGRGIPVVAISGNGTHDAAMRTVNGLAIFDRLHGIDVYSAPALHDLGALQVACLPWVSPARLVARYGGDVSRDRVNAVAAGLIVRAAAEIADPRVKPTVLMLHGSISGASLPTGISTDDLREPVVDLDALLDLGYASVVAGHIHAPQRASAARPVWAAPPFAALTPADYGVAFYTGSPLPLNFGERDTAHGVWILDVDADGTRAEFVPIESRPLVQIASDPVAADPLAVYIPDDIDGAIVKVSLRLTETERRHADVAALRAAILEAGAHTVKIDVETVRQERARAEVVTDELAPLDAFDAWVTANYASGMVAVAELLRLREQMQDDLEQVAA